MKTTDSERAERLYELAGDALQKNTARIYRMPWYEAVVGGVMSWEEEAYAAAASPALVRRLIRRIRRLEGRQ